jgi:hypothetical protein
MSGPATGRVPMPPHYSPPPQATGTTYGSPAYGSPADNSSWRLNPTPSGNDREGGR